MITQEIEELITPTELVQFYGFVPEKRSVDFDWYLCPFHKDKHASMRVFHQAGRGYYCHSCGAGGGIVNFVERYFNLTNKEAILKINKDFRLNIFDKSRKKSSDILDKMRRCKEQAVPLAEFLDDYKRSAYRNLEKIGIHKFSLICRYDYLVNKYVDPRLKGSNENIIKDIVNAYNFAKPLGYEKWKQDRKDFIESIK